jgi:peptidoglycan hydrolase-like protein with peptidoglycan-binding domain
MSLDRLQALPDPMRRLAAGRVTLTRLAAQALLRHPLRGLGWLALGGTGVAVFGNILLLQPERHRAPMFVGNPQIHAAPLAAAVPLPPQRPSAIEIEAEATGRIELMRDIQAELARRGLLQGEGGGVAGPRTARAIREFQTQAGLPLTGEPSEALLAALLTGAVQKPRDPIAGLLRTPPDRLERPATVAAVQRALAKLGYGPLKDDGQLGPGTRAALDRFERDRKLPSRAENPARVLRELSLASGMAID